MTDKKTAWKDNKSEETTVRRLHIWIFSSLRIWAHLILQQESWKAQHKVRAMRDLYMKNTLSQRDIQLFFSQEILNYKASVVARLSRFLFPLTSKTTRTWLGEKNWLTRMTKTVIRNCVSEVYWGIPEDFFPMLYDLCLVISASTHPQGVTADRQNGCLSIPHLSPPQKTSEPSWPVVASNTFHHTMRCKTIMT